MLAVQIAGGLILLFAGGELLVRGAVRLAVGLGISPLVIGLTVVGFGTSTPEMVTSVQAALAGTPGIAIGNIVGSNISNILLILGIAALILPIAVHSQALKRDGMVMIAAMALFCALAALVDFTRLVGLTFLAMLAAYLVHVIRAERAVPADHGAVHDKAVAYESADVGVRPQADGRPLAAFGLSIAGLVLLIGGGSLLVTGAVALARDLDISETVIGLTIVAVGTSLPELVTSVLAAIRRQADIAFGNIVGSNIYNTLGIGGITAAMSPLEVPREIIVFDNPAMLLASAVLVLFAWTGYRIGRREGAILLGGYMLYIFLIWP